MTSSGGLGDPDSLQMAADVKEGLAVKAGGKKNFTAATVDRVESSGHTVSRKATILNKSELRSELGKEPKGLIMKGVPCVELPFAVGAAKETFWLFQFDPLLPYRTVEFWYKVEEVVTTNKMHAEQQLFAGQPARVAAYLGDQRLESARQADSVKEFVNGSAPIVLESLKSKAQEMIAKVAARKARAASGEGCEEEEEPTAGPIIESEIKSAAGAAAAAAAAAPAASASAQQPPPMITSPILQAASAEMSPVGKGAPLMRQPSWSPDAADRSAHSDAMSVQSACARSKATAPAAGPIRIDKLDDEGAELYAKQKVATLDFNAAMTVGKQGVMKHLAADAAQKLQAAGWVVAARMIRSRLEMFSAAENLHCQSIHSLDMSELAKTVDLLQVGGIEIPMAVLKELLLYRRNLVLKGDITDVTAKQLMEIVFPWGSTGATADTFDPLKPRAIDLSCSGSWKHALFATTIGKQCVVPLITAGAKCFVRLSSVLSVVTPRVEEVVENDAGLDDEGVLCLCDWLTTSRFLKQLLDPVLLLGDDVDSDIFNAQFTGGGVILSAALEAIKATPEWRDKFLECAKVIGSAREMAPKYQEHQHALATAAEGKRLDALSALCGDLPLLRTVTPAMLTPLETSFTKCMGAHLADIKAMHAAQTLKVAQARDTQNILAKASDSFPFSQDIASWMSEVSEIMLDVQAGSTRKEFQEKLQNFIDQACPKTFEDLQKQLSSSRGLEMSAEDCKLLHQALQVCENFVLELLPAQMSDERDELSMQGQSWTAVGKSLLQFFPSPSTGTHAAADDRKKFDSMLDFAEAAFALWDEHAAAKSMITGSGLVVDRDTLDALQRRILSLDKLAEKLTLDQAGPKAKVLAASSASKEMVKSAVVDLQKKGMDGISDNVAHIQRVMAEEVKMDLWSACDSKDGKSATKMLGDSIGEVADPVLLKKSVDRLVEAILSNHIRLISWLLLLRCAKSGLSAWAFCPPKPQALPLTKLGTYQLVCDQTLFCCKFQAP